MLLNLKTTEKSNVILFLFITLNLRHCEVLYRYLVCKRDSSAFSVSARKITLYDSAHGLQSDHTQQALNWLAPEEERFEKLVNYSLFLNVPRSLIFLCLFSLKKKSRAPKFAHSLFLSWNTNLSFWLQDHMRKNLTQFGSDAKLDQIN